MNPKLCAFVNELRTMLTACNVNATVTIVDDVVTMKSQEFFDITPQKYIVDAAAKVDIKLHSVVVLEGNTVFKCFFKRKKQKPHAVLTVKNSAVNYSKRYKEKLQLKVLSRISKQLAEHNIPSIVDVKTKCIKIAHSDAYKQQIYSVIQKNVSKLKLFTLSTYSTRNHFCIIVPHTRMPIANCGVNSFANVPTFRQISELIARTVPDCLVETAMLHSKITVHCKKQKSVAKQLMQILHLNAIPASIEQNSKWLNLKVHAHKLEM